MLHVDSDLFCPPVTGGGPGWRDLQAQRGGEGMGHFGARGLHQAVAGGRSGKAPIRRGPTLTMRTGDREGQGPTGDANSASLPVLPPGAAVVLRPLSPPHKVKGHNGHHLEGQR